ncbi:MAG: hypothetical protein KJ957_04435 [Candidatus Omnitrophica bacterium]|nr:hypothetical protein [Candidatus Omnitrophota bacterium]
MTIPKFNRIFRKVIYCALLFTICVIIAFFIFEVGLRIAGDAWQYLFKRTQSSNNIFYVYVIGGSTSYGFPYGEKISFPKIISYMFDGKINKKNVKVINLAIPGHDLETQYWKFYQELFKRPRKEGILLIYSGINEHITDTYYDHSFKYWQFMQRSILLSKSLLLLKNISRPKFIVNRMEHLLYDNSLSRYEYRVEKTIKLARKYGLRIILSTLVGNISEIHPCGTDPRRQEFMELFEFGREFERKGPFVKAICIYKKISKKYNIGSCNLYYHLAKCYQDLGQYESAREYYHMAIDNGAGNRPTRGQNRVIRKIAKKYNTGLADVAEYFKEASPNGLMGYNLFSDGHHPNIEGYLLMSRCIADEMQRILNSKISRMPTREEIIHCFDFNHNDSFKAYLTSIDWICGLGLECVQNERAESIKRVEFYLKKMDEIHPDSLDTCLAHLLVATLKMDKKEVIYWMEKGKFSKENSPILEKIFWVHEHLEGLL